MALRGILQRGNAHPRGKGPGWVKVGPEAKAKQVAKNPGFDGLGLNFLKESLVYLILSMKISNLQQEHSGHELLM